MDRNLLHKRCKVFIPGYLRFRVLPVFLLGTLFFLPHQVFADWSPLVDRLIDDGFDEAAVRALFFRPEVRFEPGPMSAKLQELVRKSSQKPPSLCSYNPKVVYKGYLREKVLTRARSYLRENTDLLDKISSEYCVPKEIVVSILLVETRLGDFLGGNWAFNSLASMALCTDLDAIRPYLPKKLITPKNEDFARTVCRQKADWAYAELKALILYADWGEFDPLSLPGSLYGAIGLCQFLPSNVLSYGIDADHDGRIDLFTKADALYSIANYLREHGWNGIMDKQNQHRVLLKYNKSIIYANTVLGVAEKLKDRTRIKQRAGFL